MKIGIITFHFAFNQGAVLQCYALQKYLESQGHEVYIINYRPSYHTVMHSAWRNPFVYSHVFWRKSASSSLLTRLYFYARSFARCMYWNITGVDKKNQEAFRKFENKYLHLTSKYTTLNQLKRKPPKFDVYISGSDQVWNPDLLGHRFDRAYFLEFGANETNRITYAVSMGKKLDQNTLSQLHDLCRGLDAISLREYSQSDIEAIGYDVHICLDPTLLLEAADYADIEYGKKETLPYIFVYGFETNDMLKQAIEKAVRKHNCRIINGSPKWLRLGGDVDSISGYGPDRFLTLIKNAKCIVTNSFHGTAFSIIYEKDFITVPHSTRGIRMESLLGSLGLSFKLYGSPDFSLEKEIDYTAVQRRIRKIKAYSSEYLSLAISGRKGEDIPHYGKDEADHESQ